MSFGVKNFFSFLYKTTVDLIVYSLIFVLIVALLPDQWFANFPFHPKKYETNFADQLDQWSDVIDQKGELLLKGQIVGPESLAIVNDSIYTGLADGRLVEINKKTLKVKDITTFQNNAVCDDSKPSECGRVLGVKVGNDGNVYAMDYYKGLYRIDSKTNVKELIGSDDSAVGYDDLEFDPTRNVIYGSVMSTKWTLNRCLAGMLEPDNSGYLVAFDLDAKKSHKLRSGMLFPNGLQLSKDKKSLFVAETLNFGISQISLEDIHKALKENRELTDTEVKTFARVPGEPDNVRLAPNGDLLVALFSTRKDGKLLHDQLSDWPFIRKAFMRTVYVFAVGIDWINSKLLNNDSLRALALDLYYLKPMVERLPKTGSVVRIDAKSGQIKQIYGSERFNAITEGVIDSEGDLYFGSFVSSFLGRLKKQHLK